MSAHDLSSQDTSEYDLESTDDGSVDGDSHLPSNEIRRRITNPLTPRLKVNLGLLFNDFHCPSDTDVF
jgi:hypothetical protein